MGICFTSKLRHAGAPALEIEIVTRATTASSTGAKNLSGKPANAQLAIIIDDLGNDRAAAEAIFALGYPLTISFCPITKHSVDIAKEAHRRGFQVMLHLPMQSVANETPERRNCTPACRRPKLRRWSINFCKMFRTPSASTIIRDHSDCRLRANGRANARIARPSPLLRRQPHNAATVAYETARDFGVRSAFRNVPFLDDVAEVAAVRKQLELALRGAREMGEAVAIGHPHPSTLQALREVLPQAKAQGVRLVLASELVH